ncbi:Predicted O-linked N-acetylglucosamine transferase, SPINDLY family [Porphyromonas macacae]|uniref:Predicted O-linked N-acetylglucosamine transferase, SPINDLY family n=2 Tax=Porphyromonas macacae TaxID=28115 RepID=A0A379E846_9PORP|nr:Predicted O-linked N-acetylglucosamine transferase, SPINDLY family [Porphyromonas macacae]
MRHKSFFNLILLMLFVLLSAAKCSHNKQEKTKQEEALILFEKALQMRKREDYEAALSYYTQSIEKDSSLYGTFLNRGYVKEILKDTLGAIQDYTIASRLNKADPVSLCNLGAIYAEKQEFEVARKYFLNAILVDSLEANPYYNLGLIAYECRQFQEAIPFFKHFMELKDTVSKRLLADDLYEEQMLQYEAYRAYSLFYIGLAYKNLDQIDSAIYYLKLAIPEGVSEARDSLNLINENPKIKEK